MNIKIKRSDFYNELPKEKQKQYFYRKDDKFIPTIDNIYYSIFLEDDRSDNITLYPLLEWLSDLKDEVIKTRLQKEIYDGLYLDVKSFMNYKYCISAPDIYDIFIADCADIIAEKLM